MNHDLNLSEDLLQALSEGQRELVNIGIFLSQMIADEHSDTFSDYSFLIFPFAKAYEGFLKQEFLSAGFISKSEYASNHFRLGKALSPNLVKRLGGKSIYAKICNRTGWCELSDQIWDTWKTGRNQVFHYFPHNLHSLTLEQALAIINQILTTMNSILKLKKL